ncbi:50S ribosomal protein L11 methyltransferase [Candidatus Kinetoplastidibacterium crithidiae]|uniref:Ribosomal protein L11 methyltransferase n=1 Tax=Candidatus Kinetoplastidibacterium crithidiae TCC036E TaxID=1208918 RepID=M1LUX1_9PROT|nr:50S ribosomal protein L11 methyltransferase [Candidatus Kinetoplastibacterium crithidii]AFZ82896.1 ribosomal protein L11 methyltransferase [Candidatus Kinetoplastibacterium crithidii (ex Angomonas deanei ATCC 30255)]AGF47896.1 ribosomal protein L11 methyltransferase [Candidatus Kinetoplastibacterium crithidii TCC036E]
MHELSLNCFHSDAELLSDKLLLVGACSVSVEDADAGCDYEIPIFGEPGIVLENLSWKRNKLSVLISEHLDPLQVLNYALDSLEDSLVITNLVFKKVLDIDWVSLVQSNFSICEITDRLRIVPVNYSLDKGNDLDTKIYVRIDPGMAFGTGSHSTTSLCLSWMDLHLVSNSSVLDYGCGSGILSIAAMKLGAKKAVAVDIDPLAIDTTVNNANINNVLVDVKLPSHLTDERYNLVVANILKEPLQILAAELSRRVEVGGSLLLSGILTSQIKSIELAYSNYIKLSVWKIKDDWVCLHGIRI